MTMSPDEVARARRALITAAVSLIDNADPADISRWLKHTSR